MNQTSQVNNNAAEGQTVYGFMDPTTNVFYAFEDLQQYQLFLQWMQLQNGQNSPSEHHTTPKEEELLENYHKATEDIMRIFEDPFFNLSEEKSDMELQEIEFWFERAKPDH